MIIKVIHYTNDREWKLKKIEIKNGNLRIKPYGGLWTSPVDSKYGWDKWCINENFRDIDKYTKVEIEIGIDEENLIIIDNYEDLKKLIWEHIPEIRELVNVFSSDDFKIPFGMEIVDFVGMKNKGVDCIWLTEKGQCDTRLSYPRNLYGWDCECILILNERCIKSWRIV